jgi:hypothetical protein
MSLGRGASPDDSVMHQAVANAVDAGISIVVAAGNDAAMQVSQTVPAGFPEVIAIGSTTAKTGTSSGRRYAAIAADTASYFTTDGKFDPITGVGVAISAPGEEQENIQYPYINSLGILSTAFGVVALLLEKAPALTPVEVKARLMTGSREGAAPLDSPASGYSYDGEREGVLHAPTVLNF